MPGKLVANFEEASKAIAQNYGFALIPIESSSSFSGYQLVVVINPANKPLLAKQKPNSKLRETTPPAFAKVFGSQAGNTKCYLAEMSVAEIETALGEAGYIGAHLEVAEAALSVP